MDSFVALPKTACHAGNNRTIAALSNFSYCIFFIIFFEMREKVSGMRSHEEDSFLVWGPV